MPVPEPIFDDLQLLRLEQISLPPWDEQVKSRIIRPERRECAARLRLLSSPHWDTAIHQLHKGMSTEGSIPDNLYTLKLWILDLLPSKFFFQPIAAVLYEQACRGDSSRLRSLLEASMKMRSIEMAFDSPSFYCSRLGELTKYLLQLMLYRDYGIEPKELWRPTRDKVKMSVWELRRDLDCLTSSVVAFSECCRLVQPSWAQATLFALVVRNLIFGQPWYLRLELSDVAIMFCQFQSHRHDTGPDDPWLGYYGTMAEMTAETGSERLARRLSVDVHQLIPEIIKDEATRRNMIEMAKGIAISRGIPLEVPLVYGLGKPLFELKYRRGFPVIPSSARMGVYARLWRKKNKGTDVNYPDDKRSGVERMV